MFKVAALENNTVVSQRIFDSITEMNSWISEVTELMGWTIIYLS